MMKNASGRRALLALSFCGVAACDAAAPVGAPDAELKLAASSEMPAPPGLVDLTFGGSTTSIWPYTGTNFSGVGQDPINMVFTGNADPTQIRAALFGLDGNRTAFGFPAAFPFDCTWSDAMGLVQTSYGSPDGWTGSAMQLECGAFGPLRFHIRLFRHGEITIGNAHFELLVPGTATHQILSWELAEQFLIVDFIRSGLLGAAPTSTAVINDAPSFGNIPALIYNGVPVPLRAAIGGPLGNQTAAVPIASDGRATVLALAGAVEVTASEDVEELVITFGQVVPKPFCALTPTSLIRIDGPVVLRQTVRMTASGEYTANFKATGSLTITPIDGATGMPSGPSYGARVVELHSGNLTALTQSGFNLKEQLELPPTGPDRGTLRELLRVGTDRKDQYEINVSC